MNKTGSLLIVVACVVAPSDARAQSFLVAGVNSSLWGVPFAGCGVTTTGNTLAPAAGVTQTCTHEYTTTRGSRSTIQLVGAARTGFGQISMESSGSWTDLGAPDFTGGNWGVTASSSVTSGGQIHLQFSVRNDGSVAHTYVLTTTMRAAGGMFYSGDVDLANPNAVTLFPWGGHVSSQLGLSFAGLGGGCGIDFDASQSYLAPRVEPNGFGFSSSCTGATPAITIPAHSYAPLVLSMNVGATAATKPNIVTTLGGGSYGLDVDFLHTVGLSDFRFLVDGVPVDPATLDIASDAPVRITASGLVSLVPATTAPEPGALALVATGLAAVSALLRLQRRSRLVLDRR